MSEWKSSVQKEPLEEHASVLMLVGDSPIRDHVTPLKRGFAF